MLLSKGGAVGCERWQELEGGNFENHDLPAAQQHCQWNELDWTVRQKSSRQDEAY